MLERVQADRLAKLEQIKALGIDPYGRRYDTAQSIESVLKQFADVPAAEHGAAAPAADAAPAQRGDTAGRLVLIRDMGKMMFCHLRDGTESMQIALRKNALDEQTWQLAKLLDLGDIVAVEGPMARTKTGEVTIWAERLVLLTKSLSPMPEKWHGLSDVETRYRQRYLDLMSNPDSLATFKKRIAIIENFRKLLHARNFVEVETPVLQPIYGGAAARPFTTHHNALDCNLFMRISPELYLKRLLVGGMPRVFEFSRNFRNEGIDTRHNPEFTLLELYQAYADYEVMMEITEELVSDSAEKMMNPGGLRHEAKVLFDECAKVMQGEQIEEHLRSLVERALDGSDPQAFGLLQSELAQSPQAVRDFIFVDLCERAWACVLAAGAQEQGKNRHPFGRRTIDFTRPWRRKTYAELVKDHAGVDWKDEPAVRAKARELKIEESNKDLAVVVNEVFEAVCEPAMAKENRPTFVLDYPAELCPLTRRKADDPSIALRFECFVAGMEIANAYSELNDPAVQEANFMQQVRGEAAGETMRVMDEDFVTALRHGMPPAGGLGIGIDRIIMLLTNTQSIRDVILFPLLRPLAASAPEENV